MITVQDIRDRAAEWQLRVDIVEKDYVLGWLLAGIASHPVTGANWIFKGGTCLKKCFVETYRFSEDLDFSLLPESSYTEQELRRILREVAGSAAEQSGIEFPEDRIEVRSRVDRQGRGTFEGRVSYRGPLSVPSYPRVIFDITQHEPVLDAPSNSGVFHPYPDALPERLQVRTYSLDELLAEKTRALYERTRPRDLYDVVYLLENKPDAFQLPRVRDLLARKCGAKGLKAPSSAELLGVIRNAEELRSEWANMLAHQLPVLPELDSLLGRLPGLLQWIDEPTRVLPEARLAPAPVSRGQSLVAPAGIQYWGGGASLEAIRFAGANRLMLEFTYDGKQRRVEPYSLRRAETGNLLLYAWEEGSTHIKAFNTANMSQVRATGMTFQPRYRIELTSQGPLSAPSTASLRESAFSGPRPPRSTSRVRPSTPYGPRYVFQCPYCQKKFTHSKNDSTLRKHKAQDGHWDCPGRQGFLVAIT
ncbi:MAG: nucleotidyl transferase AbiEii/AbiGii toxin family protein [Acidobacteria bacterium]|nr:nucleotidyl transferase AbiEii/AbiGii toxin family protein [Acidobacteriota bacterium]